MLTQVLLTAWLCVPLVAYAINMAIPWRVPTALLFFPVALILCMPGMYQTYSIGKHNEAYRTKMDEFVQTLDQDGDGRISELEATPEFIDARMAQPPINCVLPHEFVYVPASFAWCAVCLIGMWTFETVICRVASAFD